MPHWVRQLAVVWAVLGFSVLIGAAIVRLSQIAMVGLVDELRPIHWLLLVAGAVFMAYSEGYRGFQLRFSPRFARRTLNLRRSGKLIECLLAPLYAMAFFSAPRRDVIAAWLLTALIIVFVLTFGLIPQPWRGIVDASVVIGLSWGLVVTWHQVVKTHRNPSSQPTGETP